jgi:hypothetical protein
VTAERLSQSAESRSHDQRPGYLVVATFTPAAHRVHRRAVGNFGHDDTEIAGAFGTATREKSSHMLDDFLAGSYLVREGQKPASI